MEKLKEYVDQGQLEIAKLNGNNQPQKIQYSQLSQTVKRQNKFAKYYQSVKQLDWNQKYQWVNLKRLRANKLFRSGEVDDATQLYLQSMIGLDLTDTSQNRLEIVKKQLKFPILLNLVTCFYKKKLYHKALQICEKVLQQQKHLPALYKKAHLLTEMGELEKAQSALKQAIQKAKQENNTSYNESFNSVIKVLKEKNRESQKVFSKMFVEEESQTESFLSPEKQEKYEILVPPSDTWYGKIFDCLKNLISFNSSKQKQN